MGDCAVHWGSSVHWGDIINALGHVQYTGSCHKCIGVYHDLCGDDNVFHNNADTPQFTDDIAAMC